METRRSRQWTRGLPICNQTFSHLVQTYWVEAHELGLKWAFSLPYVETRDLSGNQAWHTLECSLGKAEVSVSYYL